MTAMKGDAKALIVSVGDDHAIYTEHRSTCMYCLYQRLKLQSNIGQRNITSNKNMHSIDRSGRQRNITSNENMHSIDRSGRQRCISNQQIGLQTHSLLR